jgi:hypothetical protein
MHPVTLGRVVDAVIYGFIGVGFTWTGWKILYAPKTSEQKAERKRKTGTYLMIAGLFFFLLGICKLWQARA